MNNFISSNAFNPCLHLVMNDALNAGEYCEDCSMSMSHCGCFADNQVAFHKVLNSLFNITLDHKLASSR